MSKSAKYLGLGAIVLIGGATQVSSEDAISNLASWWRFLSPKNTAPEWLTPTIDTVVAVAVLITLMVVFVALIVRRMRRRSNQPVAPESDAKPSADEPRANATGPDTDGPGYLLLREACCELNTVSEISFTPDMLIRMHKEGKIELAFEKLGFTGSPLNLHGSTIDEFQGWGRYFISRKELDRFKQEGSARITLSEAARSAYEELQEDSLHSQIAEQVGNSPDDTLEYFANALIKDENGDFPIPVFGRKKPSTIPIRIPDEHLQSGALRNGATKLDNEYNGDQPIYVDLEILRTDFRGRLATIKNHFMGQISSALARPPEPSRFRLEAVSRRWMRNEFYGPEFTEDYIIQLYLDGQIELEVNEWSEYPEGIDRGSLSEMLNANQKGLVKHFKEYFMTKAERDRWEKKYPPNESLGSE